MLKRWLIYRRSEKDIKAFAAKDLLEAPRTWQYGASLTAEGGFFYGFSDTKDK